MPDEIIVRTDDARNRSASESRASAVSVQPVSIRSSRVKLSLGLIPFASLFATGVGVMVTGVSPLAALMMILPFGVLGFALVREILDRRPRITVDETGIRDRGNVFGLIEWDDITGACRGRLLSRSIVFVQIRNPTKYNDRLSPLRQLLREGSTSWLPLSVSGTQGNAKELVELIETEVRRRWSARALSPDHRHGHF